MTGKPGWLPVLAFAVLAWPCAMIGQARSVQDGVYTRDQAARGKREYDVFCASCHASDLSGTNSADSGAPPLRGDTFMEGYEVNALFTAVRTKMPRDAPAGLKDQQYIDILAYVFQQNEFPAGAAELPVDAERLRDIRITRRASRP
jgi:mono/diheme cytochrome c family protein